MARNKFMNMSMSVTETIGFGVTVVSLTLWIMGTFTTQSAAKEAQEHVEARFSRADKRQERLESKIDEIEDDVAVIRGILESRNRKSH